MRAIRPVISIVGLSVLAGFFWDILVWRAHFPYLPFHWLGRMFHADGEAAYDAMMYETMIYFFGAFSLTWILVEPRRSKS